MGMADLLPPSPAALTGQRHFPSLSEFLPTTPNSVIHEEPPVLYDSDSSSHRTEQQNLSNSTSSLNYGPLNTPHPLNYSSLIVQKELADAELDHTLKSLATWLAAVEIAFNSVLDNAIEEETDMGFEKLTTDDLRPESSTGL